MGARLPAWLCVVVLISGLSGSLAALRLLPTRTSLYEREALAELYQSTGGDGWKQAQGWRFGDPCLRAWIGVTCALDNNRVYHITHIVLSNNGLTGSLPAAISNLKALVVLDLRGNDISSSIPTAIGGLTLLRELRLGSNSLYGSIPPTAGRLANLTLLDLSYNKLEGAIPDTLFNLASLTSISLERNKLQGFLSSSVNQLRKLQVMDLSHNWLAGSLPEISGLQALVTIDMSNNRFEGAVPHSWRQLPVATFLSCDLSRNCLHTDYHDAVCQVGILAGAVCPQ